MKELVCKSCGGAMVLVASNMTAVCQYCGTKFILEHEDTDYYRSFFAQMTAFLALSKDEQLRVQRADALWASAQEKIFTTKEGAQIEIRYMHKYTDKNADVYVARRNIVFHFKQDGARLTENFRKNISMLDYPTADTRMLSDFFPKISGGYVLEDGSTVLVIAKSEDEYPLRLFGTLHGRHVAWIISRMENLCCVLEYNGLVHPEINLDTLYINPYTHQASLYGNWWSVRKNNAFSEAHNRILTTRENLIAIREVAANLLGAMSSGMLQYTEGTPLALTKFIKDMPRVNAYDDFSAWDAALIEAYGERKFITMDTDDEELYGKKESR